MGVGSHGICVPRLGTGIGTASLWTLGTGTKISGTAKSQTLGQVGTLVPWDRLRFFGTRVS